MNVAGFVKEGEYIGAREFRQNLSRVIKSRHPYFLTEHGRPVKAMIPYETLLDLLELLEELKDRALMREVVQGRKEYREGGWVPAKRLKKMLLRQ